MRAEDILSKRRDRAIAIMLSVKEREIDPLLPHDKDGDRAAYRMRKAIIDQINDFYMIALDVCSSAEADTFEFNPELWAPRIEGRLNDVLKAVVSLGNGQH